MSFKNKVVIVTGASSGIGAATAVAFSKAGASVVMVGLNEEKLNSVAARCSDPLVIHADISDDENIKSIVDQTIEKFKQLDILVNNAGIGTSASFSSEEFMKSYDEVMKVNLRAVVNLTGLATPYLIKTKGNIINISSIFAKLPMSAFMLYCISKACVDHFSVCAAVELAPHGVRVNTISPGPVKTDILENSKSSFTWDDFKAGTVLDRVSEPEEIADLVLYLASDKARAVTGSDYVTDNGFLLKR